MSAENPNPLKHVGQWDDYVEQRYRPDRIKEEFRSFDDAPQGVKELYRLNHARQTVAYGKSQREKYLPLNREKAGMWEVLQRLDELVDDSDPDIDLPQIAHALQTAEKVRQSGHPDWFVLVGLIHDAGKMLCFFEEPQWAVVGDTFPVGCAWSHKIVFPEYFRENPDTANPAYQSRLGMYEENCGLENVLMSWGHDEYIYHVVKDSNLPTEALYMLRYHSCYPWHREGAYHYLMDGRDREMLPWVKKFNPFDLYSKGDQVPDVAELTPYYQALINKYLPAQLSW